MSWQKVNLYDLDNLLEKFRDFFCGASVWKMLGDNLVCNYGNNIFMQVVLHISILDIPENCLQNNLPIFPKKLPFLEQDLCSYKIGHSFSTLPLTIWNVGLICQKALWYEFYCLFCHSFILSLWSTGRKFWCT